MSAFLDELARPTNLAPDVRLFLAQAFGGLDRHDRAADLLVGYPPPPSNATEEAKTRYQSVRLMLAREHRMAKQIDPAKAVLQEILGSWGKSDLSVRREKVFLLEDAGNFGAAVQECREIEAAPASIAAGVRARGPRRSGRRSRRAYGGHRRRPPKSGARIMRPPRFARAPAKRLGDRFWEFDFYDTRIVLRRLLKVKDPAAREQKVAAVAANIKRA